jgi:hypothetical protein
MVRVRSIETAASNADAHSTRRSQVVSGMH